MVKAILIAAIAAFITTLIVTPILTRYLRKIGLNDIDVHKKDKQARYINLRT